MQCYNPAILGHFLKTIEWSKCWQTTCFGDNAILHSLAALAETFSDLALYC